MTLKPGDILFTRRKRFWVSAVIAWFMRSRFSHASLVVGIDADTSQSYLLESSKYEVSMGPSAKYLEGKHDVLVLRPTRISNRDLTSVISAAMGHYGEPYGYMQLISFGLRRLLMRFGVHIPNVLRQGVVCCGVVLYGYAATKIPGVGGLDPESIDVQEMLEIMQGAKWSDGTQAFEIIEGA